MNAEYFQPRLPKFCHGIALSLSSLHWDNVLYLYEDKIVVETLDDRYHWRFLDIANWQIRQMWHRHVKSEYSSDYKLAAAICTGLVMCKLFKAMKYLA